jgi:hypothetical protein
MLARGLLQKTPGELKIKFKDNGFCSALTLASTPTCKIMELIKWMNDIAQMMVGRFFDDPNLRCDTALLPIQKFTALTGSACILMFFPQCYFL